MSTGIAKEKHENLGSNLTHRHDGVGGSLTKDGSCESCDDRFDALYISYFLFKQTSGWVIITNSLDWDGINLRERNFNFGKKDLERQFGSQTKGLERGSKQGARLGRSVRLVCETALKKKHAIRLCQTRILSIYRCSLVCLNNLRMRYVQQIFLVR